MTDMKLHHLAVVVGNIERSAQLYCRLLDLEPATDVIHDRRQKVYVQFLAGPSLGDLKLELLEPEGKDSPVASALAKGGGPNHLCFEVTDLDRALAQAREQGARVICEPVEGAAMDNRRIAFVFTADRQIVEFLAAPTTGNRRSEY